MSTTSPPIPADLHEYVSFDAPDEHRTWVFDLTFLSSPWRCLYGDGCPGVLTGPVPELEEGCCSYGAHLVDDEDAAAVLKAADRLRPDQWQHHDVAAREGGPLRRTDEGGQITRQVDDACIFLNRPGFAAGAGCALHQAAVASNERPMDWKPDVCWQLPLRLVEHTDDDGHVTSTLREWKRRDWGAGGHDFHWWCTEAPEAFDGHRPVHDELRDEIVELVGQWAYDRLVEHIAGRPPTDLLPHPTLRSRKAPARSLR
ncbi:MAG TPA: hypothetical protein VGJ86_17940 [Acidimicrobiales bacterium]